MPIDETTHKRRETTLVERVRVIEYRARGDPFGKIAKDLAISKSQAHKIWHDWKTKEKLGDAPRPGRPGRASDASASASAAAASASAAAAAHAHAHAHSSASSAAQGTVSPPLTSPPLASPHISSPHISSPHLASAQDPLGVGVNGGVGGPGSSLGPVPSSAPMQVPGTGALSPQQQGMHPHHPHQHQHQHPHPHPHPHPHQHQHPHAHTHPLNLHHMDPSGHGAAQMHLDVPSLEADRQLSSISVEQRLSSLLSDSADRDTNWGIDPAATNSGDLSL